MNELLREPHVRLVRRIAGRYGLLLCWYHASLGMTRLAYETEIAADARPETDGLDYFIRDADGQPLRGLVDHGALIDQDDPRAARLLAWWHDLQGE